MTLTKSEIFRTAWANARTAAVANGTTARAEFGPALRAVYGMLRAAKRNEGIAAYVAGRIADAATMFVWDFGGEGFWSAARAARGTAWTLPLMDPAFRAAAERADTAYTVSLLAA